MRLCLQAFKTFNLGTSNGFQKHRRDDTTHPPLEQALPVQVLLIKSCFRCPCRNTEWNECDLYEEIHEPKYLNVGAFAGHNSNSRHTECPLNTSHITLMGARTHGH